MLRLEAEETLTSREYARANCVERVAAPRVQSTTRDVYRLHVRDTSESRTCPDPLEWRRGGLSFLERSRSTNKPPTPIDIDQGLRRYTSFNLGNGAGLFEDANGLSRAQHNVLLFRRSLLSIRERKLVPIALS